MPEDATPQNIYDDPRFFAGYSGMERFRSEWGWGMEHAPLLAMLGDVAGKRVLDLGCGGGHLALHLAEAGAASVVAVDASARMLEVARKQRAHPRVAYVRAAMESLAFPAASFDCVVSSLALHYVEGYRELVSRVAGWLVRGGVFAFSTEHPIFTARSRDEGWVTGPEGATLGWAIDDYAIEGPRERTWFVPVVRRYHRTLSTLINGLIEAGFVLRRVGETWPDEAWLQGRPQDAEELRRPMFLLLGARKP